MLQLEDTSVQRLLLAMLLPRILLISFEPVVVQRVFGRWRTLVLLAAQLDDAAALWRLLSVVPPGRMPAEYARLADDAVATACCGAGQRQVLRCLVQLAAGARPQLTDDGPAEPGMATAAQQLAAHLSAAFVDSLRHAARDGQLCLIQLLLEAGVTCPITAVTAAAAAGQLEATQLLLPHLSSTELQAAKPELAALPAGMWREAEEYGCPLLALMSAHGEWVSQDAGAHVHHQSGWRCDCMCSFHDVETPSAIMSGLQELPALDRNSLLIAKALLAAGCKLRSVGQTSDKQSLARPGHVPLQDVLWQEHVKEEGR
jgi:hypothetical protein